MRKVNYKTYSEDAKNGKKTLAVGDDNTIEFAEVISYWGDSGEACSEWYLIISKMGDMSKSDSILSDKTANFYRL